MSNYFVGHATLEGWNKAIDPDYQVYAIMTVESRMGNAGLSRVERHIITLAQPVDDEVHYCRLHVASTEWIGDTCVSPRQAEREARAQQAWELIKGWLKEKRLQWHEAAVAVPGELRDGLIEGHAVVLKDVFQLPDTRPAPIEHPASAA
jgi:hypothetical protein